MSEHKEPIEDITEEKESFYKSIKEGVILLVIEVVWYITNIFSGSFRRYDVYLRDYKVNNDNKLIELNNRCIDRRAYIGRVKEHTRGNSKYLTFYNPHGGFENYYKASDKYSIELDSSITKIFYYRGDGEYHLILRRDEDTGEWEQLK